jgi:hypothetical protein
MSGKKQYHVDMSKWFRDRVRRSMVSFLMPSVLEAVGAAQESGLRRDLAALREEQSRQSELLEALSERTRQREEAITALFEQQITELEQQLRHKTGETRASLMDAIAEQERTWRAELRREQQERWEQVTGLEADLKVLLNDKAEAEAAATRWLGDAEAERAVIAGTLPHERYAGDALAALERRLEAARQNAETGQFQAAIAGAQQAFHDLSDLRAELMIRHLEWTSLRRQASDDLVVVRELITRSERLPASFSEDLARDDLASQPEIDVDHWSDGRLRRVAAQVDEVMAELDSEQSPAGIERIREIVATQVPEFRAEIEDVIELAQRRVEASQLRVNIADLVISVLEDRFAYEYERGGYEEGDERGAFMARLDRIGDSSVVVELRPVGADLTNVELDVLSYDDTTESARLRGERGEAIQRLLSQGSLRTSAPVDLGEPDPARRQLPSVRHVSAEGEVP